VTHLSRLAAVAVATATLSVAAHAIPILQGTTTDPTGFTGLVANGITYDVTFTYQPYSEAFASVPPTFLGNEVGGLNATSALVSALNAAGVTELGGYSFPPNVNTEYNLFVPTEIYINPQPIVDGYLASLSSLGLYGGKWLALEGGGEGTGVGGDTDNMFAVFSAQTVPEPSMIALLGAALAILALTGKRRSS
jgi:hypothetical protein